MDHEWRKDPKKRAAASRHLKVLQNKALADNKSPEQLQRENAGAQVTEGGIPVMWGNAQGQRLRGREARIQSPSQKEAALTASNRVTCASCEFFDVKNGRKEIVKQRFAEKLVLEYEWALRHIGGSIDHLGLCGQSNGELAVTTMSPKCDRYRPRRGKI